jgi:hypothetical protein
MRRRLVLLALALVALSAFAQGPTVVFEKPFKPMSPVVVGQGGSFTANGIGWDAFFTNPAALAGKGSLTLVSVTPWVYTTGKMLDFVLTYAGLTGTGGPMARVSARTVTVQLPPDFQLPPDYTGTPEQFQADLGAWLDTTLAELDPAVAALLDGTTVVIPQSWANLDPATFDAMGEAAVQGLVQDFLVENPAVLEALGSQALAGILPPGFPESPKLHVGVAAGLGLIVKGFGLGVATVFDANVEGNTVMTTAGDATLTLGFMAGYAHEFKFSDSFGLKVGGLLRPMFRVNAPVGVSALLGGLGGPNGFDAMGLLNTLYANYGTGIGIDVGAILGVGPFSVGLSVTDLFDTRFNYRASSFRTLYETLLADQTLPAGDALPATVTHVIPMDVRVGAAFHPDLGGFSFLIDPTVHLEIGNFLTLARKAKMAKDAGQEFTVRVGDIAAFGAEVRLLRFLKVRAGYYQGAISAGIGAKLLFLDVNVAAYIAPGTGSQLTQDTGIAELGDVGVTAEFALRF